MKHSFGTKVLAGVFLYVVYRFLQSKVWTNEEYALESTVVYVLNIVCLGLLVVTSYLSRKVKWGSEQEVLAEEEDEKFFKLEKVFHTLQIYSGMAFIIALLAVIIGFLLLLDAEPEIAFGAVILLPITVYRAFKSEALVRCIRPNFHFPDPQAKDYKEQLLESYDDGEKHVMLKSLTKVYFATQWLLIGLMLVLMFYSIFSGISQLFSIVAIGVVLLFLQFYYFKGVQMKN